MLRFESGWMRRRDGDPGDPRDSRWRALLDDLAKDIRFAARGLTRNPVFTVAAALTIAIGIGSTTAVLSIANAVLLRSPPVVEGSRLVSIWEMRSGVAWSESMEGLQVPYERYQSYKEATRDVFTSVAAHRYGSVSLRAGDEAEAVTGVLTSGNYFQVLGLRPAAGRFFTEDHEAHVVLSSELWRRRLGGDPAVIGQTVYIDSQPFVVAGVAPEGFSGTTWGVAVDLWIPLAAYQRLTGLSGSSALVVPFGRLQRGIDVRRAQQQIDRIARRIPPNEPQTTVAGARLDPVSWRGDILPGVRRFISVLLATGLLVLLIASANIAGMLMARAIGRRREVAVRLAIGAGRARLVRQLLTECVLLFLIGGAAGIIVAFSATRLLSMIRLPLAVPVLIDVSPDPAFLAAGLALALTIGILFGLGPALRASRLDLASTLKDSLGASGGRTGRRRSGFVVAQLALTVLLLVTAGLFTRSLRHGMNADLGFDPNGVVVATINLRPHGYNEERGRTFYNQLVERVRSRPGVVSVALSRFVLLGGESSGSGVRAMDAGQSGTTETNARFTVVDTAYLNTLRVDLVAGRGFTGEDRVGSQAVAIMNETLAQQLWPGENAVGRRFVMSAGPLEVIGITRDGKYNWITEEPQRFVFLPFAQDYQSRMMLHVRTELGASPIFEQIQREVRALDPNVAIEGARVLDRVVELSLFPQRFAAALTGLFGLVGLVLAAIGVYGVLAMHVAQRSREFGIRMALGARRGDVLRLVLARGAMLALAGATVGLVLASGVTRLIRSFLFGVSPFDAITFAMVASLLIGIALVASYVPARRATTADPLAVLRQE